MFLFGTFFTLSSQIDAPIETKQQTKFMGQANQHDSAELESVFSD